MQRTAPLMLAFLFLAISAGGCATIVRGDKQKIQFDTDPEGATVDVVSPKSSVQLTSPATAKLLRNQEHTINISKPGYQPVTFKMKAHWDGASLPNFVYPGGSIGTATDRLKGADLAFYPLQKIKLQPATQPTTQPAQLVQYRGKLYTQEEYDKLMKEEAEEEFRKDIGGW